MPKTASLLISSAVVETQYERDIQARATPSKGPISLWYLYLTNDINFRYFDNIGDCFEVPTGKQEGSEPKTQSSHKIFDDFIDFYYSHSVGYSPYAQCVGLGSRC